MAAMRTRSIGLVCLCMVACSEEDDGARKQELGGLDASVDGGVDAGPAPVENVCATHGGSCMVVSERSFCGGGYEVASYACAQNQSDDVVCCVPSAPRDAGADAALPDAGPPPGTVCAKTTGPLAQGYPPPFDAPDGYCRLGKRDGGASEYEARNDAGAVVISGEWYWAQCGAGASCGNEYQDRWGRRYCKPASSSIQPGQCITVNCGTINCADGMTCIDPVHGVCGWE